MKAKKDALDERFLTFIAEMGSHFESSSPSERRMKIEEFISELRLLWLSAPELRFSQLLYNFTSIGTPLDKEKGAHAGLKDFFYCEDKTILESIKIAREKQNELKIKHKK